MRLIISYIEYRGTDEVGQSYARVSTYASFIDAAVAGNVSSATSTTVPEPASQLRLFAVGVWEPILCTGAGKGRR